MFKHIYTYGKVFKKDVFLFTVIILLFGWAMSSTVFGLQKKSHIVVIEKNEFGSQIIGKNDDFRDQEIQIFLRRFLILYYSFDEKSFSKNMDLATNLMNDSLFKAIRSEIASKLENFKKEALLQTAEVLTISKISENKFEAEIKIIENKKSEEFSQNFKIELDLDKSELSLQNPYGYEIISIQEKRI